MHDVCGIGPGKFATGIKCLPSYSASVALTCKLIEIDCRPIPYRISGVGLISVFIICIVNCQTNPNYFFCVWFCFFSSGHFYLNKMYHR